MSSTRGLPPATGACSEVGWVFHFPDKGQSELYTYARVLCASCEVIEACAEWGIKHEEHGMWGGLTPDERMAIRIRDGIDFDDPSQEMRWIVNASAEARARGNDLSAGSAA